MQYKFINEKGEHRHELDGAPLIGTSSVSSVLMKPLTYWASGLACEKFGWINKKDENGKFRTAEERLVASEHGRFAFENDTPEEYLALLDSAYSAHAKKLDSSAKKGTDLHQEIEDFINGAMGTIPVREYDPKILPFIEWAKKNVKKFILSEAHVFSQRMWTGGITDCVAELNNGKIGVIDFKSSKDSYESQFLQIAGYSLQLMENGAFDKNGSKIFTLNKPIDFFSVIPFGAKEFKVDYRFNISELEKGFESMLYLYKLINI
jgi:hypothetical protein